MRKIFLMAIAILCATVYATPQKGTMTDPRDGQSYRTVKIGDQVWMAENLNVETSASWCYDNEESNCKKYGRLYKWDAATKACPSGWHLPSEAEFETLFEAVGGKSKAGKMLKSETGWNDGVNGTDAYGFSALPAGDINYYGDYSDEGDEAYFWSSTENDSHYACYMLLRYYEDDADLYGFLKYLGFSVRCLKDDSSSSAVSSSSKAPEPVKGTFTDSRDGKKYKTVKIGTQVWMAENLKVKTKDGWCYANKESNCKKYGRLYSWSAATKACPSGWHLPSKEEFETLINAMGGESEAGKRLKSKTGWKNNGNGTDAYGFSALPAGGRDGNGDYGYEGYNAYFLSSTEFDSGDAYFMFLVHDDDDAGLYNVYKSIGLSVRCVKD